MTTTSSSAAKPCSTASRSVAHVASVVGPTSRASNPALANTATKAGSQHAVRKLASNWLLSALSAESTTAGSFRDQRDAGRRRGVVRRRVEPILMVPSRLLELRSPIVQVADGYGVGCSRSRLWR
jgi:hypothetical protein